MSQLSQQEEEKRNTRIPKSVEGCVGYHSQQNKRDIGDVLLQF